MMFLGSHPTTSYYPGQPESTGGFTFPSGLCHSGLVREVGCVPASSGEDRSRHMGQLRNIPLCLKILENALHPSTVWAVQLDMRGLHNLLSNFLIDVNFDLFSSGFSLVCYQLDSNKKARMWFKFTP